MIPVHFSQLQLPIIIIHLGVVENFDFRIIFSDELCFTVLLLPLISELQVHFPSQHQALQSRETIAINFRENTH